MPHLPVDWKPCEWLIHSVYSFLFLFVFSHGPLWHMVVLAIVFAAGLAVYANCF